MPYGLMLPLEHSSPRSLSPIETKRLRTYALYPVHLPSSQLHSLPLSHITTLPETNKRRGKRERKKKRILHSLSPPFPPPNIPTTKYSHSIHLFYLSINLSINPYNHPNHLAYIPPVPHSFPYLLLSFFLAPSPPLLPTILT